MNDFGLYVHIPYCKSLCPYCDFNAYVRPDPPWEAFTAALLSELDCRAPAFAGACATTLYFGGGTPSLAPIGCIAAVIEAAQRVCSLRAHAEITLEVNPGTVTETHLRALRAAGVNRISLGWQSTHDRLLRTLGRGHTADDARRAFAACAAAGFDNVSLDLIFAVPGQSAADLHADLAEVLRLSPAHVSLYALTYKEGTPFHRRRARGSLTPADEDTEADMMDCIETALTCGGYEHYEVSNYARPGRRAVHNSLYWQGACYLGLGPGAHSFHHQSWHVGHRWEATRDPRAYLAAWHQGPFAPGLPQFGDASVAWVETLTAKQLLSERMLCGLRHTDGVSLTHPPCGAARSSLVSPAQSAIAKRWAHLDGDQLRPTALGLRHADALAALFF